MISSLIVALLLTAAGPAKATPPAAPAFSQADRTAAFRAAGFTLRSGKWQGCGDPGTMSYTPGAIDQIADLNGDGLPEALISEGSTYCFGASGEGYWLISKRATGGWVLIESGEGIARFLKTRGVANWPDMQVGGPGFCFPVLRWNGRAYAINRYEYEGKRCRPRQ